jgi:hypothetical protein
MTLGNKSGCKPSRKISHSSYKPYRTQLQSRLTGAHLLSGKGAISGSSSSRHVHHNFSKISGGGACFTTNQESLSSAEIQVRTAKDHLVYKERMDFMTTTERKNIATLHSTGAQAEDDDGQPALDIMDILSGENPVDISHVGGEFADFLAFEDDLLGPSSWYVLYIFTLAYET